VAEDNDLESYWAEVRQAPRSITLVTGRVGNVREGLELAALKTSHDLSEKFKASVGKPIDLDFLTSLVADGVGMFLKHWCEDLRHRDTASLVEVVLEGRMLPIDELKAFVRALPKTLLDRVLKEGGFGTTGSGIHALLAVEWHFRERSGRDYELRRDPTDDKLVITAYPSSLNGAAVTFRLDEKFQLDDAVGVNPDGTR
jgi:hypothetical protein